MQVLIIGNGGREHALAWKAAQSAHVSHVFVAPGNAGTACEPKVENIAIEATAIAKLVEFAQAHAIDLTIVGPETPLAAGIVDAFQQLNLPCFGPTQAAAQLEASKTFSRAFMSRYHIPTAKYAIFTGVEPAKHYVSQHNLPLVIKADGLAAGKGVIIAHTETQAFSAIDEMLNGNSFGTAGKSIVIEEYLVGEEASFIVIADGTTVVALASSQDHKARDNGDLGPNTGGMGAYSPAPIVTPALHQQIIDTVIQPTLRGMLAEGIHYCGFLYAGLMIMPSGELRVLEFNCRLGDPETQVIMLRLQSDLVTLCLAALTHTLTDINVQWDNRPALGVVLAAKGYPFAYPKREKIEGLDRLANQDTKIFHAGTQQTDRQIVTDGGRVLCVTALGDTISATQAKVYAVAEKIHWPNIYYRTDIGHRAIARERQTK